MNVQRLVREAYGCEYIFTASKFYHERLLDISVSQAPVFGVPTGGFQAGLPGEGARRKIKAKSKKNTPPAPPSASNASAKSPQSSQPPLQSGSSNYGGFGQTTPAAGTPSEAFGAVKGTPPEFGFGNAAGRTFGGAVPFQPRVSPQQGFSLGAAPMSKQPSISVAGGRTQCIRSQG